MTNAALKGIREMAVHLSADDHARGAAYEATRLTIMKADGGWEARRGGKLVGITLTREGALELLGAL